MAFAVPITRAGARWRDRPETPETPDTSVPDPATASNKGTVEEHIDAFLAAEEGQEPKEPKPQQQQARNQNPQPKPQKSGKFSYAKDGSVVDGGIVGRRDSPNQQCTHVRRGSRGLGRRGGSVGHGLSALGKKGSSREPRAESREPP